MYRCRECKTEYREKVEYCDCGNNTFDYIEDKISVKKEKATGGFIYAMQKVSYGKG